MNAAIRKQLFQLQDKKYAAFSGNLIPDSLPLIGVRLPSLRRIAREMAREDWRAQLGQEGADRYLEEVMLRGMVIGYGTERAEDPQEAFQLLDAFVPLVDNWSVCDSFCQSFSVARKFPEQTWEKVQTYLQSGQEFCVRIGLILSLVHLLKYTREGEKIGRHRLILPEDLILTEETAEEAAAGWLPQIFSQLSRPFTEGYYASMAAAWLTAEAFVVYPAATWQFLQQARTRGMDEGTFLKACRKIRESRNPSLEVKQLLLQK